MLYGIISAAKLVNKWALSQIIILKFTNIPIIYLVIKTIIRKFAPSLSQENYMKTIIHGPSISKVTFIDPNRARIQLETGETYIVAFPGPSNYLSGDHFIQLLGWEFDLYWGTQGSIQEDYRLINSHLYRDGYDMMLFVAPEQNKTDERKRIGERIKELRKKRNLDAKTLASRIGIDASNLCRIEQGHYSVGFDILSKIANALNAKVDIVENDCDN